MTTWVIDGQPRTKKELDDADGARADTRENVP